MSLRVTYRLQFHKGFTFADAEAIAPYLASLGVSHVYASPITVAQPGSTHGYDVVDPTRINPELGGEEGFRRLAAALRREGLGIIIDIVPNHMGVAGSANAWWQDVLAKGRASAFARFFDIDWSEKILLPLLGEPVDEAIAKGALTLQRDPQGLAIWAYGTHRFPLRPEDQDAAPEADIAALLDRQHYRLAWWRTANDLLNWRRFFTITELAGLRQEDSYVFEETHALVFRLWSEGLIDGVRIDHVDGLSDPAAYCRRLRERLDETGGGRRPYMVVEKILGPGEALPADWAVDGTSGYDFMNQLSALLHAPEQEGASLSRFWSEISGRTADFHAEELQARMDMLSWEFEGQLTACVRAFERLARSAPETRAFTGGMLRRAIETLLWVFPVYRTYGTGTNAPASDADIRAAVRARAEPLAPPGEMLVVDAVLVWLAGSGVGDPKMAAEAVRRFQQLSAPIAAKAVEDTAFYRYARLLSRNDVGFDAACVSMPAEKFHEAMVLRAQHWPRAMLATATHDHKRGEDVRARLAVLSEVPDLWIEAVRRWRALNRAAGVAPDDEYQLYQTLYGAWPRHLVPEDEPGLAAFRDRLLGWQEKALREAKLRSSWTAPDASYETRAHALIERLLDPKRARAFLLDFSGFCARLRPAGEANALAQALFRNTAPGVPDLYQGCEFEDLSLVDPDNRRPVDYAARQRALEKQPSDFDGVKQHLIARILRMRREQADLWSEGGYMPLEVKGERADSVIAFARILDGRFLLAAAVIRAAPILIESGRRQPPRDWWSDTRIVLPENGELAAGALFEELPVAIRFS